jgi:hypothetical protein
MAALQLPEPHSRGSSGHTHRTQGMRSPTCPTYRPVFLAQAGGELVRCPVARPVEGRKCMQDELRARQPNP